MPRIERERERSYAELEQAYAALKEQISHFSVVQQQLINTRDQLDRELVRFGSMQRYNTLALQQQDIDHFALTTVEAVIEIFELEFGLLWLVEEEGGELAPDPNAVEGLATDQIEWQPLRGWLAQLSIDSGGAIVESDALPPAQASLSLSQLLLYPCMSERGLLGYLFTGVTLEGADFYDPAKPELLTSFNVFGQQVSALLDNRLDAAVIKLQMERIRISEQQQRLAKEEALQANEAKGLFLANMSHEIRTPMNGVLGMMQMLQQTPLNEQQLEYLTTAIESGDWLMRVINDTLDYSKIDAGKLKVESAPFALAHEIEAVASLLQPRAEAKSITLDVALDPALPEAVAGDSVRLRQILTNLVGNSIKFTQQGGVMMAVVRLPASTAQQVWIRFDVKDSGIGISKEVQSEIFNAFAQADNSTTRKFGGTGLGLSISKRLVQLMGGELLLESEPEQGARFWFELPFSVAATAPQVITASQAEERFEGEVLLVEDHWVNQKLARSLFESLGLSVTVADNGQVAVDTIKQRSFGAIFMDCQMPLLDGYAATKLIRKWEQERNLPRSHIIALTANATSEERTRCIACGMDDFLTKPFNRNDIIARLQAIFAASAKASSEAGADFDSKSESAQVAAEPPSTAPLPEKFSGELLLVEDNLVNQKIAEVVFKSLGLTVTIAANGEEAVAICRQRRFDIIFMDLQMPVMDGFDATIGIRHYERQQGLSPTPIIALTANATDGHRERCFAVGMDDFLTKPLNRDEIVQRLATRLV
ncbi:response regulator [Ectothiorhodospiraceae bacterium BW-2]|nr:response regulator [Ectothiorhodospiraceae bacterium BW-2]